MYDLLCKSSDKIVLHKAKGGLTKYGLLAEPFVDLDVSVCVTEKAGEEYEKISPPERDGTAVQLDYGAADGVEYSYYRQREFAAAGGCLRLR